MVTPRIEDTARTAGGDDAMATPVLSAEAPAGAAAGDAGGRRLLELARDLVLVLHPHRRQTLRVALDSSLDLKRKYWRSYWSDMYPGGPDQDDYILIKITPSRIEFMNFTNAALPQPYGLKPNGVERRDGVWKEVDSRDLL